MVKEEEKGLCVAFWTATAHTVHVEMLIRRTTKKASLEIPTQLEVVFTEYRLRAEERVKLGLVPGGGLECTQWVRGQFFSSHNGELCASANFRRTSRGAQSVVSAVQWIEHFSDDRFNSTEALTQTHLATGTEGPLSCVTGDRDLDTGVWLHAVCTCVLGYESSTCRVPRLLSHLWLQRSVIAQERPLKAPLTRLKGPFQSLVRGEGGPQLMGSGTADRRIVDHSNFYFPSPPNVLCPKTLRLCCGVLPKLKLRGHCQKR